VGWLREDISSAGGGCFYCAAASIAEGWDPNAQSLGDAVWPSKRQQRLTDVSSRIDSGSLVNKASELLRSASHEF
jgi:hypothetical protein